MWGSDKWKHSGGSLLLMLILTPIFYVILGQAGNNRLPPPHSFAFIVTLLIGVGKEVTDYFDISVISTCPCYAEFMDLVANVAGALLGLGFILSIQCIRARSQEAERNDRHEEGGTELTV